MFLSRVLTQSMPAHATLVGFGVILHALVLCNMMKNLYEMVVKLLVLDSHIISTLDVSHFKAIARSRSAIFNGILYIFFVVVNWMILFVGSSPHNINGINKGQHTAQLISIFLFILISSLFAEHMTLDKLSATKMVQKMNRNFIRFISHELLSHLNHVCFGLDELEDNLASMAESNAAPHTSNHFKLASLLVADLQKSSDNSVQMLNDVLLFETLREDPSRAQKDVLMVKPLLKAVVDDVETTVRILIHFAGQLLCTVAITFLANVIVVLILPFLPFPSMLSLAFARFISMVVVDGEI